MNRWKAIVCIVLSSILLVYIASRSYSKPVYTYKRSEFVIDMPLPTREEHRVVIVEEPQTEEPIDEYELYIMAHVINGEAGSNWCSDEMMYGVGSVVLNRVNHKDFPNSIESVVFQRGQYACTWDGNYNRVPCDRAWRIAEDLLRNGPTMPDNVVFQSQGIQGSGIYKQIQNMYFCYR